MAKVQFGIIPTETRGKVGGVVYTRDRGGAYVRALMHQVNPRSPDQLLIRAIHTTVCQAWSYSLTQAQRDAWQALGALITRSSVLAITYHLQGINAYQSLAVNALLVGGPLLTDPPQLAFEPDPGPLTASASGNDYTLTLTPTATAPPGHMPILRATKPLSPGTFYFNKWLRMLRRLDNSPLQPNDLSSLGPYYVNKFGPLPAGQKIGLQLQWANPATGAVSAPQSLLITIGGPEPMLLAITGSLTPAQIIALHTTPLAVIPAPGPGRFIAWYCITLKMIPGSIPYNAGPNDTLNIFLQSQSAEQIPTISLPSLLNSSSPCWATWFSSSIFGAYGPDPTNSPLMISAQDNTITQGNGTVTYSIDYEVDTTP